MFKSFFPNPRIFFTSAALWSLLAVLLWMFSASEWGIHLSLPNPPADAPPIIGAMSLVSKPHLWFSIYFLSFAAVFALVWRKLTDIKWFNWSVLGSIFIVYSIYQQVQLSVAINDWYGEFYNLIQKALSEEFKGKIPASDFYNSFTSVVMILFWNIVLIIFVHFFTSHYVFRWRQAMTEFYTEHWQKLRTVEGASQRVQEDTMRFASLVETLGSNFINAMMSLIAFLPILSELSTHIKSVPIIGAIPHSLLLISIFWALFGTAFLALIGIKLPGLEFKNQRVEAALRKELVYGEDNAERADPVSIRQLFSNVRKNYFTLYWNYLYFNLGRYFYLQADGFIALFIMIPTIAAGTITFGIFRQISNAMGEVKEAMQYLVRSWPSIIELLSIYKRLRIFEQAIYGEADVKADEAYGAEPA